MQVLHYIAATVIGYLLGAMPIGYLIGKLYGVDMLQYGSGRTGGTNVMRAAGPWAAALTVLGDGFKGLLAVGTAALLVGTPAAKALAGLATIIGHNWSVFLGWRGGAGSVASLGVITGLYYPATIGLAVLGIITLLLSRMASMASLSMAAAAPLIFVGLAIWGHAPWDYAIYGLLAGVVTTIALLPNIHRILSGTERRLELNH
ncbi:MAG: glycerol-3-phosphate acyltransferase [Anaerolineae bacterium]|nr:MAG: glycerol-3-phosphate acyltransferase [Anaerolineae bacterium]